MKNLPNQEKIAILNFIKRKDWVIVVELDPSSRKSIKEQNPSKFFTEIITEELNEEKPFNLNFKVIGINLENETASLQKMDSTSFEKEFRCGLVNGPVVIEVPLESINQVDKF